MLNIYDTYSNRRRFWDEAKHDALLNHENLLWPGYFNLTLSLAETWGNSSQLDGLCAHFFEFFYDLGLMILPLLLWGQRGVTAVGIIARFQNVWIDTCFQTDC